MGHCPSSIYLKPNTLIWTFSTLSYLSSPASSSRPLVSFPFPIRRRMYPGYAWGWGFIFKNYMLYWCCESWLVSSQLEDHCDRRGLNTSVLQGFSVGRQIIWHQDFCPFLTIFRQIQHFSAALQQSIIKGSEEVFPAKVWYSEIQCKNPKKSRDGDTLSGLLNR